MASRPESYQRDESTAHQLDRNYDELLQELRVAETGVQILFAFLLGIAFQQRFSTIDAFQRDVYLGTLAACAVAAALLIAPVAIHRILFRRHLMDEIVASTSRLAGLGLIFLGLAVLGAVLLIFDVVATRAAAVVVTSVLAGLFLYLWLLMPLRWRGRIRPRSGGQDAARPEPE
jgi:hypothetical protein